MCTHYDWCYFIDTCENVAKNLDPLTFTLGSANQNVTVEVPPSSYLIPDRDWSTNLTLCHLGVIGQRWHSTMDNWVLGEDFMQNVYVAFDATDARSLKIGIASQVVPSSFISMELLAIVVGASVGCITFSLCMWCCIKSRREKRAREKLEFFQAQHRMNDSQMDSAADLDGPNAHLDPNGDLGYDEDPGSADELRLGQL